MSVHYESPQVRLERMAAFTVDVPLPPRELSPNARVYRMKRAQIVKDYRDTVELIARLEVRRQNWTTPARARISLHWCIKGCVKAGLYNPRDYDNAVAVFKPAQDGIVRAGVLQGDDRERLEGGSVTFDPKTGPWVRVTIEEIP